MLARDIPLKRGGVTRRTRGGREFLGMRPLGLLRQIGMARDTRRLAVNRRGENDGIDRDWLTAGAHRGRIAVTSETVLVGRRGQRALRCGELSRQRQANKGEKADAQSISG